MSEDGEHKDSGGLEILNKADAVLRGFEEHGQLNVQQLAQLAGEPISSTYRLVAALGKLGWVDKGSARGSYRLGLSLVRIGGACEDALDLRAAVHPALRELHEASGATSLLWVRRGEQAVCIDRIDGRDLRLLAIRLGDAAPLYVGGGPRALLAHLAQGEQIAILDRLQGATDTRSDVPSRDGIEADLRSDLSQGWSISRRVPSGHGPDIIEIGAPVVNHRGELEAALAVRGLAPVMLAGRASQGDDGISALGDFVGRCADAASRALGFVGSDRLPTSRATELSQSGSQHG